jgi:hypothetical protein
MNPYELVVVGNTDRQRTEVEVWARSGELLGVVFEDASGWCFEAEPVNAPPAGLGTALAEARRVLEAYVNRRGEDPPEGLTAAGLSFWLMENSDGTSMGVPVRGD